MFLRLKQRLAARLAAWLAPEIAKRLIVDASFVRHVRVALRGVAGEQYLQDVRSMRRKPDEHALETIDLVLPMPRAAASPASPRRADTRETRRPPR